MSDKKISDPKKWLTPKEPRPQVVEDKPKPVEPKAAPVAAKPTHDPSDPAATPILIRGDRLAARDVLPNEFVAWVTGRGKWFDRSSGQLEIKPDCTPVEAYILAKDLKHLTAYLDRTEALAKNHDWQDDTAATLAQDAQAAAEKVGDTLGHEALGEANAGAWNVLSVHFDCIAEAIRTRNREELYRVGEEVKALCRDIREWARDPKKKPPV